MILCPSLHFSSFFFINIFLFFSHTTSQHNIHSKQTNQNNRHILHVLKVQSKGRERGREKVTTKRVLPLYNHICYKKKKRKINRNKVIIICNTICLSTHVRRTPALHVLLAAAKPANSLLLCIKLQEDTHLYQQSYQSAVRKIKPGLHASTDPWQQDTPKTHEEKYPMTQCYISGHQK